jgi:arylsulfatase A-like enzyme
MGSLRDFMRVIGAAALGGAWGGIVVGLVEAVLVTATAAPGGEYWLFPFALISYGLLGTVIGCGYAVGAALLFAWRRRPGHPQTFGTAAALALLLLGSAVARYHVIQRIFHEELVTQSATGIAVNLGVVAAVGILAAAVLFAGRALQERPRGLLFAATALIAFCAVSVAGAALASPRPTDTAVARRSAGAVQGHPNVILIIADTLRADAAFGSSGRPPMPALQALAKDAVRFEHAYSQSSWTRPSIATILTSLYPSQHGAIHKMDVLSDTATTLAEALGALGYWTAGFVSNINVAPVFNFQQGFDEYTYLPPDFYFGATDSATRLAIYKGLRVARERFWRDRIYYYNYYQDAAVVDTAVSRWLDEHPPSPFFLLVHYMDPHDPYFEIPYDGRGVARVTNPNPAAARTGELQQLYGEDVQYLDGFLERLFARLKRLGLYDSSIIVFTADHGEEFQEHGGWWHGTTLYEEQVHVPVLIKRAHEPRAGESETALARTLDLAPTIVSAAGFASPPAFAGRDLFKPAAASPVLFAEEDLEGNVLNSLRAGPWKLITANPDNPRGLEPVELYNLDEDPAERHNQAHDTPERVDELLRLLSREQAAISQRTDTQADRPQHAVDHRS